MGTFKDVATYVAERDAVVLSQERKDRRLYVVPSLDLDPVLFNIPLTMCIEGVSKIKVKQGNKRLEVSFRGGNACFDFNPRGEVIVIAY